MNCNSDKIYVDLSEPETDQQIQSRAREKPEPATTAGFSFLKSYGDKKGTMKYVHYKPAKIYSKGAKWFVYYSYLKDGKFVRFKVYEDLNRIKDLKEKREYAEDLKRAVNLGLSEGFNPFKETLKIIVKNWTLVQGLNFFKQKIPDMGVRPKTANGYEGLVRMFTEGFRSYHNTPINEITKTNCHALLNDFKRTRGWSNTTFNNALTFGRLFFSYLIQSEITEKNPFKQIKPLPEVKTQNQPFDDNTFELIKRKAPADLLRFMLFMYHTGARRTEAQKLKYEHILRDRKLIYIPGKIGKVKTDRYNALSDAFLQLFPEGKGFIFGMSSNYFTAKFTEFKRKYKLKPEYTLYNIRHTRALHLVQAGATPYTIMQYLGHASLEMTMNYLKAIGLNIGTEAAEKGLRM